MHRMSQHSLPDAMTTSARPRDADATRRALLDAARTLFARDGYDATTVRAVARLAGVSTTTASKVLNGRGDVGASTRERVLAVMAELGYRPTTARHERSRDRSIITVLDFVESRYAGTVLQGILVAATAAKAEAEQPKPAGPAPSELRGRTEKMSRLRALIAKRMVESLQTSAQLTTVVEVDVTRIAKLRDQVKADFQAKHGIKLSFLPFFALAAIEALQRYPVINARMDLDAGTITYPEAEHLGIAVDTERGLMVPVIHNAGDLNLAGLARRIADLAERTRTNKISPDEIAGATFTLTNTGSRGALFDTPIVPSPQSAMLGTGAVVKRPVVVDDPQLGEVIVPRSMVYLALSYDHRLIDGADAARFLTAVKERLEAGQFEAELGLS